MPPIWHLKWAQNRAPHMMQNMHDDPMMMQKTCSSCIATKLQQVKWHPHSLYFMQGVFIQTQRRDRLIESRACLSNIQKKQNLTTLNATVLESCCCSVVSVYVVADDLEFMHKFATNLFAHFIKISSFFLNFLSCFMLRHE